MPLPSGPETAVTETAPSVSAGTGSAENPTTGLLKDDSGDATIAETSKYASYQLKDGDPTSSVADPTSQDPTTFKKPEISSTGAGAGAGAGKITFRGRQKQTLC